MATNPPPNGASIRVYQPTILKAVSALLRWHTLKTKTRKPQLLEEDNFIYLVVTLKKIPVQVSTNAHKIFLPHPLHTPSTSEICLIIDDRPKSKITSESAKKKVQSEGIPVSKILKLSKLKTDYCGFERRRKLCNSYDMFLTDNRVLHLLPKLLGKQFFKKKKIPVPIDMTRKNWKEQIDRVCGSALLFLRTGTCSVVKVARVSMGEEEIVDNVVAAIDRVGEVVPRKWSNVRSCHLKLSDSVALPLYQVLPDIKLKIEGVKSVDGEENGGIDEGKRDKIEEKDGNLGKVMSKKGLIREVRYMDLDTNLIPGDNDDVDNDDNVSDSDKGRDLNEKVRTKKVKKGVQQEISNMGLKKVVKAKNKNRREKFSAEKNEDSGILDGKKKSKVSSLKSIHKKAKSTARLA